MRARVFQTVVAVLAPLLVFLVVASVMSTVTGRQAALDGDSPAHPEPLNMRLQYDAADAAAFWRALGAKGRVAEQRFLEFDLVFPTLYGGTLAASLLWLSRRARWHASTGIAPVIVGVVSDWTENLVQLEQLRRYVAAMGLQPDAIWIASIATATKLLTLGVAYLLLFVLAVIVVRGRSTRAAMDAPVVGAPNGSRYR